jgi:DNA-binding NarL/FixJ family response regulator
VDWGSLSDRSLQTLAQIAVPISQGLSHADVASQTGLSEATIAVRLRLLRKEISEQIDRLP